MGAVAPNMKFIQLIPADGWYFIHTTAAGEKVFHRVALWGQAITGEIVGLMSIRTRPQTPGLPVSLLPIPEVEGCYVHEEDFSSRERELLNGLRG